MNNEAIERFKDQIKSAVFELVDEALSEAGPTQTSEINIANVEHYHECDSDTVIRNE